MKKVLIIPDIHGRIFWMEDVTAMVADIDNQVIDVVFLGDYVDPYPQDGITDEQAIMGFRKVIGFAKDRDNVHLLLGNHDLQYFKEDFICEWDYCRYCMEREDEIKSLFRENDTLFKIAWQTTVNGRNYMFTHAGIVKEWISYFNERVIDSYRISDFEPTVEYLNKMLFSKKGLAALSCISRVRGGRLPYGSPVWADIEEHWNMIRYYQEPNFYKEFYQIFGHSKVWTEVWSEGFRDKSLYYVTPHFAMLDAMTSFILNDDGKILPIGGEQPDTKDGETWMIKRRRPKGWKYKSDWKNDIRCSKSRWKNDMKQIQNESEYQAALAKVEALLPQVNDNTPANDPKAIELVAVSEVVIDYEKRHYEM